jgi:hypothetical protein
VRAVRCRFVIVAQEMFALNIIQVRYSLVEELLVSGAKCLPAGIVAGTPFRVNP